MYLPYDFPGLAGGYDSEPSEGGDLEGVPPTGGISPLPAEVLAHSAISPASVDTYGHLAASSMGSVSPASLVGMGWGIGNVGVGLGSAASDSGGGHSAAAHEHEGGGMVVDLAAATHVPEHPPGPVSTGGSPSFAGAAEGISGSDSLGFLAVTSVPAKPPKPKAAQRRTGQKRSSKDATKEERHHQEQQRIIEARRARTRERNKVHARASRVRNKEKVEELEEEYQENRILYIDNLATADELGIELDLLPEFPEEIVITNDELGEASGIEEILSGLDEPKERARVRNRHHAILSRRRKALKIETLEGNITRLKNCNVRLQRLIDEKRATLGQSARPAGLPIGLA